MLKNSVRRRVFPQGSFFRFGFFRICQVLCVNDLDFVVVLGFGFGFVVVLGFGLGLGVVVALGDGLQGKGCPFPCGGEFGPSFTRM